MSRFQDQNILITGGTSGIGLATAQRIEREGGRVIVTGSRPQSLEAARSQLSAQALLLQNDAGEPHSGNELAEQLADVGPLHGAFLNAGCGRFHDISHYSVEEFDAHYHVNVRGLLLHAQALAPRLGEGGSLLATTSVARSMGMPAAAIYSSTKGAVRTLVRGRRVVPCSSLIAARAVSLSGVKEPRAVTEAGKHRKRKPTKLTTVLGSTMCWNEWRRPKSEPRNLDFSPNGRVAFAYPLDCRAA